MELLIVRHAIARERNTKRWPDDRARPLSPRGVMRARRAAAGLGKLPVRPLRVLMSPLKRTRQTAAILTEHAAWPRATACAQLEPGHSPEEMLSVLRATPGQRIALIGHQPDLSRFIAACLPGHPRGDAFELRKMSVALLAFEGPPRAGQGTLRWLVPAKLLRALR